MTFLVSCLLCYGIVNILVQGVIFDSFKEWLIDISLTKRSFLTRVTAFIADKILTIMNCPMCAGFHVGWFVGIFLGPFVWWNILFNGALYSGVVWIINSFVQFLGNGNDPNRSVIIMTDEPLAIKHINKEERD